MPKFLFFVALLGGLYIFYFRTPGPEVKFPRTVIKERTAVKKIALENRLRVVLFTGTKWCPACKHLDKSVISTPAWREFEANEIQFFLYNIPSDRSQTRAEIKQLSERLEVKVYPTMLVLDSENNVLSRQVGAGPPVENFKAWIRGHEKLIASAN